MKCCCDACHYIFEASLLHSKYEVPRKCPKCGKKSLGKGIPAVRAATDEEIKKYMRDQQKEVEAVYAILNGENNDEDGDGTMPEDFNESTEEEVEDALRDILQYGMNVSGTILDDAETETFSEAGVLTMNRGLVLRLKDGSEYQLTIVQSR